jgi:hypothetical protein
MRILSILSLLIFFALPVGAQLLFNELQSSNLETLRDEEGDFGDWIELYNSGPDSFPLGGWWLSDKEADPYRWSFPEITLAPDSLLLIMASGKDRRIWLPHWETIIDRGDIWRYRDGLEAPEVDWREPDFNDSGWAEGPSGFGSGDGDDSTFINVTAISCFIRKTFTVEDLVSIEAVLFHVDYDDAYVAYLNGEEIARGNIGNPGEIPEFDALADSHHEARLVRGLWPDLIVFEEAESLLVQGENTLAIEVHNARGWDDMSLIPFLSLGLRTPPEEARGLSEDLLEYLPYLHTNFSIDSDGEDIFLTSPEGATGDTVSLPALPLDYSRGRSPDEESTWLIYPTPTPDAPNGMDGATLFADPPEFSEESGYYSEDFFVWLSTSSPNAEIRYTHDSSEPCDTSRLFTIPIYVEGNKAVRARCFEDGKLPSPIVSRSFIFDGPSELPLISLISDSKHVFDEETGFYVIGNDYDPEWPYFGANFWEDWERPFHVDYILPDGSLGFTMELGMKIHGGYSRAFSQKSLRMIPRGGYGQDRIDYALFAEKNISSFKRIILRNSGSEWPRTVMRDALAHRVAAGMDLDRQAYEPAVVFLNGQYWGIYNIREKVGRYYLEENHGVDPDNIDLLEFRDEVIQGDASHYLSMLDYIETNGLEDSLHYEYIQTQMEVDNFAAYTIFEIFTGNTDWPGGNVKFWRPRTPEGRWRWLLFDLDVGLGFWEDASYDTFAWATDDNGWGEQNAPWSTFLLRNLLENSDFRTRYVNRYADYLNDRFRSDHYLALMDNLAAGIEPEISKHMERWGLDYEHWLDEMNVMATFIEERPAYAREHLRNNLALGPNWRLDLDIDPPGSGSIRLEGLEVDSLWSGDYFLGNPVRMRAIPAMGFRFAEWSDSELVSELALVDAIGDSSLTAHFEPDITARVVINEINYHGLAENDPEDWVEIYNPTPIDLDLSSWRFSDGDDAHVFVFPEDLWLESGHYLVICENLAAFAQLFPNVQAPLGNLGFGFSGAGEALRLYDDADRLIDRVEYDDAPPWPLEADGFGATLELLHPDLDNALAESWAASIQLLGTPGARNSAFDPVAADEAPIPQVLEFTRPWPNPFNPTVNLRFGLPENARARLDIYDLRGRHVASLHEGALEAGFHDFQWRAGKMASGVYFVHLQVAEYALTRKILLLK